MNDDDWKFDPERAFEITVNIGVIVFVEMTLKWNNITKVHSLRDPGQFMPLMIALAQLLAIIYQAVSKFAHIVVLEDEADFYGTFFSSPDAGRASLWATANNGAAKDDETDCIHENKTTLLKRRRNHEGASQDGVELA